MKRDLKQKQLAAAIVNAREALERVARLAEPVGGPVTGAAPGAAALLFKERRRRDECFPEGIFWEPNWDILLALFIARDEGRELRQIDVLKIADVAGTTGLRMLEQLEQAGLVHRRVGDGWKNKRIVVLTDNAIARMERFLSNS